MGIEDIRAKMHARLAAKTALATASVPVVVAVAVVAVADTRIKIERLPLTMGAVEIILHDGASTCPRCTRQASRLLGYCRRFDLALVIHCGCLTMAERCGSDIAPQVFEKGAPEVWRETFLKAIEE